MRVYPYTSSKHRSQSEPMKFKFNFFHILILIILVILLKITNSGMTQYLNLALAHNPASPLVQEIRSIPNWVIPVCLLLMQFLIAFFIWSLFSHYYYQSLPEKIFKFLTEKDKQKGKQARTIQDLSEKIKNYYEEKNLMLTSLSHDIKTPLTEALLQLEVLDNSDMGESIKQKLFHINEIITTSLEYSREPEKIQKQEIALIPMIQEMIKNYQQFGFSIHLITQDQNILWLIEPLLFKRMLQNFLDNAKRHGTEAEIHIQLENNFLKITIQDNGPGVPEEFLEKLTAPYFRVDPSRSQQTGGTGLGLAIARKITEIHHGSITLSNAEPHGLKINLEFKKI